MKTILYSTILALAFSLALTSCSNSNVRDQINDPREGDLSYRDLMLRDYDQMNKAVKAQVRAARLELKNSDGDDADSLAPGLLELKRALKLVFSRPNSDNMVAKLVPEVRRELVAYDSYPQALSELAKEGVRAFDKSLGVATVTLATYTFMLDNILAEIQREAKDNPAMRDVIRIIADANLKIPKDVVDERKLSGMFLSESPSEKAKAILTRIEEKKK